MNLGTIIFLTSKDAVNHKDWSGIPYYLLRALQTHYQVKYIKLPEFKVVKLLGYYFGKLHFLLFNTKYIFDYGIIISFLYGVHSLFLLPWNSNKYKLVFIPAGLTEAAFIWTKIPIINYGDCSTLQMIDYYPSLTNVSKLSKWEIKWVEARSINKSFMMIMSSSWAADFIQREFKKKCQVIPFGANLDESPAVFYEDKFPTTENCQLLLIGVDWIRKGAVKAIELHEMLIQLGIKSQLIIVGMKPPSDIRMPNGVEVITHINKDSLEGRELFKSIWLKAHFLVLPTSADCTPIVIAEAFANAVPVLATNTGGISSMVEENTNGKLLDLKQMDEACLYINQLINQPAQYTKLAQQCRNSFQTQNNWNSWVHTFAKLHGRDFL